MINLAGARKTNIDRIPEAIIAEELELVASRMIQIGELDSVRPTRGER